MSRPAADAENQAKLENLWDSNIAAGKSEPELLLYTMLSPVSMIGLPFIVNSTTYYLMVYAVPLGLMVLIMLLNKNYQVFTVRKVMFYGV